MPILFIFGALPLTPFPILLERDSAVACSDQYAAVLGVDGISVDAAKTLLSTFNPETSWKESGNFFAAARLASKFKKTRSLKDSSRAQLNPTATH